jgi:hypothetical protein
MDKSYKFSITGGIDTKLKPILAADGGIVGFQDEAGNEYKPIFALEVITPDGDADEISTDSQFFEAGFHCLDYDSLEFIEINS